MKTKTILKTILMSTVLLAAACSFNSNSGEVAKDSLSTDTNVVELVPDTITIDSVVAE